MKIVDRGIVYDGSQAPPERRFAIAAGVACLQNGTWVVTLRVGDQKETANEDIYVLNSRDAGATWQVVFSGFGDTVVAGRVGRIHNLAVTEVSPNRVMGSMAWYDRTDPSLQITNPVTTGVLPSVFFVAESEDAGKTWGPLRCVDMSPHKGVTSTGASIIVLKDGNLILPYESWKAYDDPNPALHYAALRLSTDGGQTWTGPIITDNQIHRERDFFWDQHLSIHPDSGDLVAMFWAHNSHLNQDLPIHIAWGSPDALQWSTIQSTGIAGQITAPTVLPSGQIVAVYNHRHDPAGIRAVLSNDFGQTWRMDEELLLYGKETETSEAGMEQNRNWVDYWDDFKRWTFGLPATCRLGNDEVLVVYYAGDMTAMSIHWARIAVDARNQYQSQSESQGNQYAISR
jgi:hypothetical protein